MMGSFTQMVDTIAVSTGHSRDLIAEAWQEAERHRWIESKKRGYDVGESAYREWFRCYWRIFCRRKWLQHLEGEICWSTFSMHRFGVLRTISRQERVFRCLRQLAYCGAENLDILFLTAANSKLPREDVLTVLRDLDVNESRLASPYSDN